MPSGQERTAPDGLLSPCHRGATWSHPDASFPGALSAAAASEGWLGAQCPSSPSSTQRRCHHQAKDVIFKSLSHLQYMQLLEGRSGSPGARWLQV